MKVPYREVHKERKKYLSGSKLCVAREGEMKGGIRTDGWIQVFTCFLLFITDSFNSVCVER